MVKKLPKKISFPITSSHLGVLLLSIALVITMITIFNIITTKNGSLLTGAATSGAGQTNLTISSTTSISFPTTSIAFGAGYVGSGTECVMATNGQHNQSGTNCYSFINVTQGFFIENDGNMNLSINFSCTGNCSAASFIGGTNPSLQFRVLNSHKRNYSGQSNDTAPSCLSYNGANGNNVYFGGWNISYNFSSRTIFNASEEGVYTNLNFSHSYGFICGNKTHFPLWGTASSDSGVVDINISIPEDAPAINFNSSFTLTFTAASS